MIVALTVAILAVPMQADAMAQIVLTPLFVALHDAASERATSPECVQIQNTRKKSSQALQATAAWGELVNSPELRAYNELRVQQLQASCPASWFFFAEEDDACAALTQKVNRAREAMEGLCAHRALLADPAENVIEATYSQYPLCRSPEGSAFEAALATRSLFPKSDFGRFWTLPWQSFNDLLATLRATEAHRTLLDVPAYATLLSTAIGFEQQCLYTSSTEGVCADLSKQLQDEAAAVEALPLWQALVLDAAYQALAGKVNGWANACY